MSQFDHDDSEESVRGIVFGDLPVPLDVEKVGEFEDTPVGRLRELLFPAAYSNPVSVDDGAWIPQEVRLIGHQAENGKIGYGVRINVNGDVSDTEAALVAAAIEGASRDAERNNNQD
jgi:hypothetical protein